MQSTLAQYLTLDSPCQYKARKSKVFARVMIISTAARVKEKDRSRSVWQKPRTVPIQTGPYLRSIVTGIPCFGLSVISAFGATLFPGTRCAFQREASVASTRIASAQAKLSPTQ